MLSKLGEKGFTPFSIEVRDAAVYSTVHNKELSKGMSVVLRLKNSALGICSYILPPEFFNGLILTFFLFY